MADIFEFIIEYSLPVFVLACCTILLIGILKVCKVFNKIKNKNLKKFIYYALNIVLTFGITALYYTVFNYTFETYITFSLTQVGATTTLYAIYENFGARKLIQLFLLYVGQFFKSNPEHRLTKAAKAMGIAEEQIAEFIAKAPNTVSDSDAGVSVPATKCSSKDSATVVITSSGVVTK